MHCRNGFSTFQDDSSWQDFTHTGRSTGAYNIKAENHLTDFSDSSWRDCPDTGRIIEAYIIFYRGGPIDHGTHVPGPVAQYSADSEYNEACTAGMALANFRMLIHFRSVRLTTRPR